MNTTIKSPLKALALLLALPLFVHASGFPLGRLLASDSSTVYLVDPATASSNRVVTGLSGLKDVVFNPVSGTAFAVVGGNIVQITGTSSGYSVTPFIIGVSGLQCLAIDALGRVYYNQEDFVEHSIWRATLDGTITAVTPSSFFVPRHMTFSRDFSKMYVFETPENDVKVVALPAGTITTLAAGLDFPPGGDCDLNGNVYVLESFSTSKISRFSPSLIKTVVASQSWMNFTSGDDLEFDDATGTIYATSTTSLYALAPDLTYRKLLQGSGFCGGLSLIRAGVSPIVRQPGNVVTSLGSTAVFSVEVNGAVTYQWRFNGTNIPGATSSSLTIAGVSLEDAGSYSVFVVSSTGAGLSSPATLSIFALAMDPVVTLVGPVGAHYRIEYILGIEPANTWQLLTNVTATSSPFYVVDTTSPRPPARFYRAAIAP